MNLMILWSQNIVILLLRYQNIAKIILYSHLQFDKAWTKFFGITKFLRKSISLGKIKNHTCGSIGEQTKKF